VASTLIGFVTVLSAAVWVIVVWLVALAWRDDLRRGGLETRGDSRIVGSWNARPGRDIPTPAAPVDDPLVEAPPVAPASPNVDRPAPMVEVLDSESGAWERLITLHRAENLGGE